MKRNPLWDAQAQQFLKSGVLQNSLARLAAPGAGQRPAPPAIPMSMIDRPVEPPQPQPQQVRPPQQMQPAPMQPQQPQPFGDPAPAPRMGEYDQAPVAGQVQRRPAPVMRRPAPAAPMANQGTPFQYRVSKGVR